MSILTRIRRKRFVPAPVLYDQDKDFSHLTDIEWAKATLPLTAESTWAISSEAFDALQAALDREPESNDSLAKLFSHAPVWDENDYDDYLEARAAQADAGT